MIPVALKDVAGLTGARLVGPQPEPGASVVGSSVEVDSRLITPGGLFVALPGEHSDGHDHVPAAAGSGAVAALTSRPVDGALCLVVDDPLVALQALARELWQAGTAPLTFGITGSSGKTSTKDLLAAMLARLGPTLAPVGSFNNEIGLPLTALRREVDTRYAVLEYSARGVGHIAFLTGIVTPHVSIVLNVGTAHLGEFGSRAAIAQAKGELVEPRSLHDPADGRGPAVIVLNADDRLVLAMASRTTEEVLTFGRGPDAVVRAQDVELDEDGRARFRLVLSRHGVTASADVALRARGEHAVDNALAAAAAVFGIGLSGPLGYVDDPGDPATRLAGLLSGVEPASRWRMEVAERADGVTVVNDAYNANPDSMRAALKTLAVMSRGKTRRTVAVLGYMGELGEAEREQHMDLGRFVVRLDIGRLVVVGPEAGGIHAGAVLEGSWGSESLHVDDVEQAIALLRRELEPGDVVLIKGSRSAGLERVAAALMNTDGAGSAPVDPLTVEPGQQ